MADTIETFVAKLQSEGVEAGKQEAEKIRTQAEQDAERTKKQAAEEAEKILADARSEAENIVARGRTELQLAARDELLRLRDALSQAIRAVLERGARSALQDVDFIGKALHEIILTYASSDVEGRTRVDVNVSEEMKGKLVDWALHEIVQDSEEGKRVSIDLHGRLREAGFEYTAEGATVEVTTSSVVASLSDLVSPELRKTLEQAAADDGEKSK